MSDLKELCESINKDANNNVRKQTSAGGTLVAALIALCITIFLMLVSFGIGIWVMIAGWGLTAQSWPIIILGLVLQVGIVCVMTFITSLFK